MDKVTLRKPAGVNTGDRVLDSRSQGEFDHHSRQTLIWHTLRSTLYLVTVYHNVVSKVWCIDLSPEWLEYTCWAFELNYCWKPSLCNSRLSPLEAALCSPMTEPHITKSRLLGNNYGKTCYQGDNVYVMSNSEGNFQVTCSCFIGMFCCSSWLLSRSSTLPPLLCTSPPKTNRVLSTTVKEMTVCCGFKTMPFAVIVWHSSFSTLGHCEYL